LLAQDIKSLTGIRLFAALWVVLFHFRDELARVSVLRPLTHFLAYGYLAVPLFFILSGFILSHTYFRDYRFDRHAQFVYRRFARLWPVHIASLVALFAWTTVLWVRSGVHWNNPSARSLGALPFEVAMVRTWWSEDLIWNYPAWSIQSEWFAYIFLFPLAYAIFGNMRNPKLLLLITAGFLAGATFLPIEQVPGMCAEIVFPFLAGSALYRLRTVLSDARGSWYANVGVFLFLVAVSDSSIYFIKLIYLSFALLIFGLSFDRGLLSQLLSNRVVVYGGLISYSMYMTHAIVLKIYSAAVHRIIWPSETMQLIGAVAYLVLVFFTAMAFYHLVEAPSNYALRKSVRLGSILEKA
jgi:peptidoglycan/LPS O-acetylase OafA/YrhL